MNSADTDRSDGDLAERPWFQRLQQARFTHLLIALIVLIATSPIVSAFERSLGKTIAVILIVAALATVLITASLAISESQRQFRITLTFAAACLVLTLVAQLVGSPTLRIIQLLLTIGFLAHVTQQIVSALFRRKRADYDTIAASLCGYLLIGVAFAVAYSIAMEFGENEYSMRGAEPTVTVTLRFGNQHTATALYFSFVTLTTLGYGDIVPLSMPTRMLTTAEALMGQLYLVVLVARLVALHISTESPR